MEQFEAINAILKLSEMSKQEAAWLKRLHDNPRELTEREIQAHAKVIATLLNSQNGLIRTMTMNAITIDDRLADIQRRLGF